MIEKWALPLTPPNESSNLLFELNYYLITLKYNVYGSIFQQQAFD